MESYSHAIPDADFAHRFQVSRDAPELFFGPTPAHDFLIAERRKWLSENPLRYAAFLPDAAPLLDEAIGLLRAWGIPSTDEPASATGFERCVWLSSRCELDFLLLGRENGTSPRLLAGSVCFASGWALEEKIGQPLTSIHSVVPELNDSIGGMIETFLTRLRPGAAWHRANWGLSASTELNQHPCRCIPPIQKPIALERIWLRIEDQALVALPASNGVLFGIRISNTPLNELHTSDSEAARRLIRALRTIPDEMATYKRIADVRQDIAVALEAKS